MSHMFFFHMMWLCLCHHKKYGQKNNFDQHCFIIVQPQLGQYNFGIYGGFILMQFDVQPPYFMEILMLNQSISVSEKSQIMMSRV